MNLLHIKTSKTKSNTNKTYQWYWDFGIFFNKKFKFGFESVWDDGPNYFLYFGFIAFGIGESYLEIPNEI